MQANGFSVDIEADGFVFESRNIWTICLEDLDTDKKLRLNPFKDNTAKDQFCDWLASYNNPKIVFHNGLGYDIFVLYFLLGIDFTVLPDTLNGSACTFVDTFYLSMFLNPDREGHSIEYFGDLLGLPKIDFRQELINVGFIPEDATEGQEFRQYHPLMDTYCERDTLLGKKVYKKLISEWIEIYGSFDSFPDFYKVGQKTFYLMSCQDLSGWKFDSELAKDVKAMLVRDMEQIRSEVEPLLPPRSLKKTEELQYKMPSKPFKKDGSIASSLAKWIEKHSAVYNQEFQMITAYGITFPLESNGVPPIKLPMEMANQDQMKDWFLSIGWEPQFWNLKRGLDGKPERDPVTRKTIQTTPKIQEGGKLCPNLEAMEGDLVKKVVKWLSLRNRLSVLTSWTEHPRLEYDGRIGAGRTGIAATHRQKHRTVVNVPKASEKVLYGKEFRSLWTSDEGFFIAAADAAALEGRVQGHYCFRYDQGKTAEDLLSGDPHSRTAKSVYADELKDFDITARDFNKDDPKFKPYRDRSKNIFYAAMYGAGDAKIASTAGLPEKRGKEISEKFWQANAATKELRDNLEKYWSTKGKSKYLPAIDGRMLCTRKKSALLNTIFQSCGGILMDYAGLFMNKWLGEMYFDELRRPYYLYKGCIVRRIGYFHDELEYECQGEETAKIVAGMVVKAIIKAGEYLELKIPLAGEGKVGKNWKEVH